MPTCCVPVETHSLWCVSLLFHVDGYGSGGGGGGGGESSLSLEMSEADM